MEDTVFPPPPSSPESWQTPNMIGAEQELPIPTAVEPGDQLEHRGDGEVSPQHISSDTPVSSEGASSSSHEAPFVIHLMRLDLEDNGHFRPGAMVELSPLLRTSGLLAALPAEELQTLLSILTFVTANGACLPAVFQVAEALRISNGAAQARLERLLAYTWNRRPVIQRIARESGMDVYSPTSAAVVVRVAPDPPAKDSRPAYVAASRETVIAHSRATYARPRIEVERDIAQSMGWPDPYPETPEEAAAASLQNALLGMGLLREQVSILFSTYPLERIQRQMEWLPYRNAKSPGRFLLAAIAGDYEPPQAVRNAAPESEPDTGMNKTPGENEEEITIVPSGQEGDATL